MQSKCTYNQRILCSAVNISFNRREIRNFCFSNTRHLHPNDLHGNSMVCTVVCVYLITTLMQS